MRLRCVANTHADTLVDVLTVEEMLLYTAQLKRPLREDHASKSAAVDALIHDLGLEGCRNTLIGNSMNRGISGGQVCCHSSHSMMNGCLHPKHGSGMWRLCLYILANVFCVRSNS